MCDRTREASDGRQLLLDQQPILGLFQLDDASRQIRLLDTKVIDKRPHEWTRDGEDQRDRRSFEILVGVGRRMQPKEVPDPEKDQPVTDTRHQKSGAERQPERGLQERCDEQGKVLDVLPVGNGGKAERDRHIDRDHDPGHPGDAANAQRIPPAHP